jgi:hypothetical protein
VLHPAHKLKYFEQVGWDPLWIETAHTIVEEEYERSYAHINVVYMSPVPNTTAPSLSIVSDNIFDNLPILSIPLRTVNEHTELDAYLNSDVADPGKNGPLFWWYEHAHIYPHLSRMALDYLSIPGKFFMKLPAQYSLLTTYFLATTVDVERTFSQGRIVLSHIRSRLSVQSTRALMCLGSWSQTGFVSPKLISPILEGMQDVPKGTDEMLEVGWDRI